MSPAYLADITQWPELPTGQPPAEGGPGRVDLWCFDYETALAGAVVLDEEPPHALRQAYLELLLPDERARHDRYIFARDRLQYLATRALVRTVLSQYADVAPTAWRFATGERGKPYIVGPDPSLALHFNLSNTRGLIVCAVSRAHRRLGCDTEDITRRTETVAIAEHYFSPLEVAALTALPESRHRERFFSYWTLKESYIKARGLGLALPLDQFSFLLDGRPEIGIAFDPRLADDPRRWRFDLRRLGARHFVALGVDTDGAGLDVQVAGFVPLAGRVPLGPGRAAGVDTDR